MRIVSGIYRNRNLKIVQCKTTRETTDKVRQAIFNMLGQYFLEGNALDLFAGSGAMGLEAISRGIAFCYFNDSNYEAVKVIKDNIQSLKVEMQSKVLQLDYMKALEYLKDECFDLIFLDPPYKTDIICDILTFLSENEMVKKTGYVICETDRKTFIENEIVNFCKIKSNNYGNIKVDIFERMN